jgi:antirestriction protein
MTNTTTTQDKACQSASREDAPSVYVGTYNKYNAGSIKGRWLTLTDYKDKQEFMADCHYIHRDDDDAELMFQDWEFVPAKYISEGHICETLWSEYLSLDEDERDLLNMYRECVNQDGSLEDAQDAYYGAYESEADFAEAMISETEIDLPCIIVVDWEATWRCNLSFDFASIREGNQTHIFNSN